MRSWSGNAVIAWRACLMAWSPRRTSWTGTWWERVYAWREVREADGHVIRKLGHKVRLSQGPAEVACTNFYVNDEEWAVLIALPARQLRKTRHMVDRDGLMVAVDEHEDGTLIAEIDDHDRPSTFVPDWLDVVEDVSDDESWTGGNLAQ